MTFRRITLADAAERIVDNRGRTCPTAVSGIPLIATNCIKDDHRHPVYEKVRYVSAETYNSWFRGHPEPGDLIFVCKGAPGRVAIAPDPVDFVIAQDMVAIRPDERLVHPRYLYYILKSKDVRERIENLHVGTMIPHFKKGDFKQLRFFVHSDLNEQAAIAEVLGALDDKIAANEKLTVTADDVSRLMFRRARSDREVPLSATAEFVNGRAFTKNASGTGRVIVRIAELNNGIGGSTVRNDIEVADKHIARPGDLLFAWSGSLTLKRWHLDEAIVNQHIFKVLPKSGYPMWLVNQLVDHKLGEFIAIAANKATTMGHIQRKNLDELVRIPDENAIAELDPVMNALWNAALEAELENEGLKKIRNALLPQLMSGKLRVRDAERVVSNAV